MITSIYELYRFNLIPKMSNYMSFSLLILAFLNHMIQIDLVFFFFLPQAKYNVLKQICKKLKKGENISLLKSPSQKIPPPIKRINFKSQLTNSFYSFHPLTKAILTILTINF
jgi:hypothetical protein